MIEFRQKEFTDKDIAKDLKGYLVQAVIHILKLPRGYNYEYDKKKHEADIESSFLGKSWERIHDKNNKDRSKGSGAVIRNFKTFKEGKTKFLIKESQRLFRDKYHDPNCIITKEDIDFALKVVEECLDCDRKEDMLVVLKNYGL